MVKNSLQSSSTSRTLRQRLRIFERGMAIAEILILSVLILLLVLAGIRLFGGNMFAEDVQKIETASEEVFEPNLEDSTIQEGGAITKKQETAD